MSLGLVSGSAALTGAESVSGGGHLWRRGRHAAPLAALLALLLPSPACLAQQPSAPPAQAGAVRTFQTLSNSPLPPGTFVGWCGREDRYLLIVQGWIDVYQGKAKVSAPSSFSSKHSPQCRQDGRELVYYDYSAGQVNRVEIETGKRAVVATFKVETRLPEISFSPDLQSVATNRPFDA